MKDLLNVLEPADYQFLAGIIQSDLNLTDDSKIDRLVTAFEEDSTDELRTELNQRFEREIGYLGSSEIAYGLRYVTGSDPGVPFQEIVRDVAEALKVDRPELGTDRQQVEQVATAYATKQFANLSTEEQQQMLEELGVEKEKAAAFLKRSAGVFALPMLIEAFNIVIVQGLIKSIIFGTIAKIIGQQLANRLFAFLVGRLPWWVNWIGPAAWTLSIGWTTIDLQGPAKRKTIPIVLYLGLCSMRPNRTENESA
ncbi:MAG: hypothetical protein IH853_14540 [Bacteroidetes bacterium]|nr:hypothetical protein [Bacteroidota bacterium]